MPRHLLRSRIAPLPGGDSEPLQRRQRHASGRRLVCRQCGHLITHQAARFAKKGDHEHVVFNPHGLVFRIGCFRAAPGCHLQPPASHDFSWFPGYAWTIARCQGCQAHLGWMFTGAAMPPSFYGLILPRLRETDGM